MKKKTSLQFLAQAAVIAAAYTVLTWLASLAGLAYGPVQFRFSEALTILPALTPAAVPGLTVGCFLSNLLSTNGPLDVIVGTAASLIAAILTYLTRRVTVKGLPWLGSLFPVAVNAIMIGWMITFFIPDGGASWEAFLLNAGTVGLGQLVCCAGGGLPLFAALKRIPALRLQRD
ncbi:MAG: QueT transporter family protein [Oscillospiraceae bacterium]|jgi:uncharacterized membrane protein|nr:QueT transporter family protein [Oscillospiraceae bacterium]